MTVICRGLYIRQLNKDQIQMVHCCKQLCSHLNILIGDRWLSSSQRKDSKAAYKSPLFSRNAFVAVRLSTSNSETIMSTSSDLILTADRAFSLQERRQASLLERLHPQSRGEKYYMCEDAS